MMGFDAALTRTVIEERFKRRGGELLEKNLKALEIGRHAAAQFPELVNRWTSRRAPRPATCPDREIRPSRWGSVVGRGGFFAGTDHPPPRDGVPRPLPAFRPRGRRQAEDELAAVNMVIGAAYTGARVMTSTSGPGLSLMTEGIGHAGTAEVPIVVADCQRVGPSTASRRAMSSPTCSTSPISGHGEFPRFVIAPGTVEDVPLPDTWQSLNLAERWRLPVILLIDQALCQNTVTSNSVRPQRGPDRPGPPHDPGGGSPKLEAYKHYQHTPDGVSPYAPPGTPGS